MAKGKPHVHRCTLCKALWDHAKVCSLPPYAICLKCEKQENK